MKNTAAVTLLLLLNLLIGTIYAYKTDFSKKPCLVYTVTSFL